MVVPRRRERVGEQIARQYQPTRVLPKNGHQKDPNRSTCINSHDPTSLCPHPLECNCCFWLLWLFHSSASSSRRITPTATRDLRSAPTIDAGEPGLQASSRSTCSTGRPSRKRASAPSCFEIEPSRCLTSRQSRMLGARPQQLAGLRAMPARRGKRGAQGRASKEGEEAACLNCRLRPAMPESGKRAFC